MDIRPHHRFDHNPGYKSVVAPDYLHRRIQEEKSASPEYEYVNYTISVDSLQRDKALHPASNRFKVYLRNPLYNVVSCELVSAEVPNVGYTINRSNQRFAYEEDIDGTLHQASFMIPIGHYDGNTLCSEIERLMNVKSISQFPPPNTAYSVQLLNDRNKAIFVANDPEINRFRIDFGPGTCHEVLGFPQGVTPWNVEPPGPEEGVDPEDPKYAESIVSNTYVDVGGDLYVYLCSPELNSSFHDITYSKETVGSNVLNSLTPPYAFGKIALVGPPGSAIFYNNRINAAVSKRFNPPLAKLACLEFQWMRADGSDVDFVNLENSFTLVFTCAARSLGPPQFVSPMTG